MLKVIEVTADCIKIKDHRLICNISKGTDSYDVVNYAKLSELNNKLFSFQKELNDRLVATVIDILGNKIW